MERFVSAIRGMALLLVAGGLFCTDALAADPAPPRTQQGYPEFQKQIQPFFNKYCIECHSATGTEPDIRFDLFTDQAALEKWSPMLDKAVTMIGEQKMPPRRKPQPTPEELKAVLTWLKVYTSAVDCEDPATKNPGRVTIRRLNREEYNNTIRDLLAMDFKPAASFPADDAGYGFDNIGDVLSVAPVLMEKYLAAANVVMDKAIFSDPIIPPTLKRWTAATMEGSFPQSDPNATVGQGNRGRTALAGRIFNYAGEIYGDYEFPSDGEYLLRIRGYGRQRPMIQFKIDDENAGKPVPLTEDIGNTKFYGPDKVKVSAGKHRVTLSLINGGTKEEYDAELAKAATQPSDAAAALVEVDEDAAAAAAAARGRRGAAPDAAGAAQAADPAGAAPPATQGARGRNANRGAAGARRGGARGGAGGGQAAKPMIGVVYVEVEGPLERTPERMSESYRRVMVAHPSATVTKPQAAEQIIRNFASKAYRRPVADDEVKQLMDLWSKHDSVGDSFESSINTTLQAVLASPYFLYRYERDPSPEDAGVRTLDEYELASRLSYFLWSSMPDDELFALAAKNQLRANLDAQVKRMLGDPKSQALVDNFAGQWLKLRMMNTVTPDSKTFPNFDDALRQAMITETQMLFLTIMRENRSIVDFIDADFTFLNERLAKHYGIDGVTGDEFRRVKLASADRGGLLTQASILTITSYPGRTSPVQRGKWVLENLFDSSPPPPPADVPALKEHSEIKGTLRQRMEQHRANPACATCHEQMDAIGFGLENFDAIGTWRATDEGSPIDATGSLPGGQTFNGPAQLKQLIKARQDDFCKTLSSKLLTYALGRGLEKYDKCSIDEIVGKMKSDGYKFSVLVNEIVHSEPFQKRAAKQ